MDISVKSFMGVCLENDRNVDLYRTNDSLFDGKSLSYSKALCLAILKAKGVDCESVND